MVRPVFILLAAGAAAAGYALLEVDAGPDEAGPAEPKSGPEHAAKARELPRHEPYGAGHRFAWLWYDRSHGAALQPEGLAREIDAKVGRGPRRVSQRALTPAEVTALIAFSDRA